MGICLSALIISVFRREHKGSDHVTGSASRSRWKRLHWLLCPRDVTSDHCATEVSPLLVWTRCLLMTPETELAFWGAISHWLTLILWQSESLTDFSHDFWSSVMHLKWLFELKRRATFIPTISCMKSLHCFSLARTFESCGIQNNVSLS